MILHIVISLLDPASGKTWRRFKFFSRAVVESRCSNPLEPETATLVLTEYRPFSWWSSASNTIPYAWSPCALRTVTGLLHGRGDAGYSSPFEHEVLDINSCTYAELSLSGNAHGWGAYTSCARCPPC
ncbi:hypothetical protein C8Q79DRAFT_582555 [Trametes meyenii]|nr:hypothetical protein C8Q79DRAFT_582555 [Trametes meyenii]